MRSFFYFFYLLFALCFFGPIILAASILLFWLSSAEADRFRYGLDDSRVSGSEIEKDKT